MSNTEDLTRGLLEDLKAYEETRNEIDKKKDAELIKMGSAYVCMSIKLGDLIKAVKRSREEIATALKAVNKNQSQWPYCEAALIHADRWLEIELEKEKDWSMPI